MGVVIESGLAEFDEFFAPSSTDMVDGLIAQYRQARQKISEVAAFINAELNSGASVIDYFLEGNRTEDRGRLSLERSAAQLFQEDGAIAALNSAYWSKTLDLTDIYDAMPQKRRDEWNKSLQNPRGIKRSGFVKSGDEWELPPLPEFTEDTVRATLADLLCSRQRFFAERVDGIFRSLSHEHITNSPMGFGKRMIIGYMLSYSSIAYERAGYINDLRCIIAKFMGRDEPKHYASGRALELLRHRWGEWVTYDGGALRIRLYKKGTAHLEVHPDMAWRLNQVLAHLYPAAIPSEFRQKPKRKQKDVPLMQRPLPFAVVELLAGMEQAYRVEKTDSVRDPYRRIHIPRAVAFDRSAEEAGKHALVEAEAVLESIGGVKAKEGWFQFDYDPREVLDDIVASGCIPDQKAHQFYPTPAGLAQRAVELAEIGPDDACLEPSAGTGGLAEFMPKDKTTCIEISELRCAILEAKGYQARCADFLKISALDDPTGKTPWHDFDRIVMNPPFDQGRWQAHLEHAATLLQEGGRIVAILPSGARNRVTLQGFNLQWHGPFDNQFPGASVSVVILAAERKA